MIIVLITTHLVFEGIWVQKIPFSGPHSLWAIGSSRTDRETCSTWGISRHRKTSCVTFCLQIMTLTKMNGKLAIHVMTFVILVTNSACWRQPFKIILPDIIYSCQWAWPMLHGEPIWNWQYLNYVTNIQKLTLSIDATNMAVDTTISLIGSLIKSTLQLCLKLHDVLMS